MSNIISPESIQIYLTQSKACNTTNIQSLYKYVQSLKSAEWPILNRLILNRANKEYLRHYKKTKTTVSCMTSKKRLDGTISKRIYLKYVWYSVFVGDLGASTVTLAEPSDHGPKI
jgi:hypothetical protein